MLLTTSTTQHNNITLINNINFTLLELTMTEAVVDTTPIAEDPALTSADTDDDSIKTEVAAPPEAEKKEPNEEEKADAFLGVLLNLWAMITGKVKEIDDNVGVSTKVNELNEQYHVTEKLNEAKDATVKKAGEIDEQHQLSQKWCSMTEALTEKFWKKEEDKEFVVVDKEDEKETTTEQ